MKSDEKPIFVDNTQGNLNFSYEYKFNRLFHYRVQKDLLRYCIYSISLNDKAHDLEHVYHVCANGLGIFNHYRDIYDLTDDDELIIMLGCLMHDLGCRYDRKDHHLIGYGLVYEYLNRYCPGMLTSEQIKEVAICVLEHRSSNKNKPTTFLSEIVSIADTGEPNVDLYISRGLKFRLLGKAGSFTSKEGIISDVYHHMLEEFGENGYHWNSYSPIGQQYYVEQWERFKEILSNKNQVMEKIEEQYDQYINEPWVVIYPQLN